jgi:transposase-like protein
MKKISHKGYRFPLEIIQQAIWLYVRFTLSSVRAAGEDAF